VTDDTRGRGRLIRRILLVASGILLAAGAVVLAGAGFTLAAGRVSFRVHAPWRLLVPGALAAVGALSFGGPQAIKEDLERAWAARAAWARWMAGSAAVATLLAGLLLGTRTAGSADTYGYVSQALLWLKGSTVEVQPLAARVPWPSAEWSLSPLGYRPAVMPEAIVPTYPPGLPLVMAGAMAIAGRSRAYGIVPLLGAAAVWLTFLYARRAADAVSGAAAAVLLAASPVFLFQLFQPMSDVPVTAWWLGALLAVAGCRPGLGGTLAAAAVLTRPNLAPLAVWALLGVVNSSRARATRGTRLHDAAAFTLPVAAALAFLGALNTHWYGHPLATGYGAARDLFSAANIPVNILHYLGWLIDTETPFVLLAAAAPALAWFARGRPTAAAADGQVRPAFAWFSLGFAALVFALYLPYAIFTEWSYLRFVLPALPVLLALSAAVALRLISALPAAARLPMLAAGLALLAGHYVATAGGRDAFRLQRLESRYQAAGAYAARSLPPTAVLLSVQESGPLRLYGGRTTVRFDYLDPSGLDAAIAYLQQAGCQPYFALEAWEEAQFRERFSGASALGSLDWPPIAEVGSPVKVRFYDPRDRARFLAGDHVRTAREPGGPGAPDPAR
jgi:hypothetical protein